MEENKIDSLEKSITALYESVNELKAVLANNNNQADEMFTIEQAAAFLKLGKQTVYGYVSDGIIPHSKISRRLYFSKKELIEWIKTQKNTTMRKKKGAENE